MRARRSIARELGHEFEIGQYVNALGTSSTHVRFVMLAIIIAIIAAATTLWSEQEEAWERTRINKFYEEFTRAEANDIWHSAHLYDPDTCPKVAKEEEPPFRVKLWRLLWEKKPNPEPLTSYRNLDVDQTCAVLAYFKGRGITTKAEAEEYAEKLYEAYVNNMLYIHVPVLGTIFDVNDLGLITGVTFFVLMLVMDFYTHRAHENLAVCMWKVREIAEKEQCFDIPGGKPNLLYHALAMQQVFTIPPTLARWEDSWIFRRFHYVLFILPFFTELAVTFNDVRTARIGAEYSAAQTQLSLKIQFVLLIAVLFLCCLCCSHLYADDVLWRRVFYFINPAHRFKVKPRWIHWIHLAENRTPSWGLVVSGGSIFLADSVSSSIWRVTGNKIIYESPAYAKGLFLEDDDVRQYSTNPGNQSKPKNVGWFKWWKSRVSWSEKVNARIGPRPEIVRGLLDNSDQLKLWERRIDRYNPPDSAVWSLGGAEKQMDGTGDSAGFQDIRAIIPDGSSLFVTDGAWLRKIDDDGVVTTWGGKPLAEVVRREPPYLLGLHSVGDVDIESEREFEFRDFKPRVLVCDFSTKCVLGVTEDAVFEMYKSKYGWAPAGVFVKDDSIYLLEHRRGFFWNEQVTSLQTTKSPLGLLFWGRIYARVLKFSSRSFSSHSGVMFQISPRIAGQARAEAEKALKKKRAPEGIRNPDWRPRLRPYAQFLQVYRNGRIAGRSRIVSRDL